MLSENEQQLRAENDHLRSLLRSLRDQVRGSPLPTALRAQLSKQEDAFLHALVEADDVLTREALVALLYDPEELADLRPGVSAKGTCSKFPKTIDILAHHLRVKVEPLGISIETLRGRGWRLPAPSRAAIERMRT